MFFLFKCLNGSRYSIESKIQLSVSFPRGGNRTFNVSSEMIRKKRTENSLPAALCSSGLWEHLRSRAGFAAGNISRHQNLRRFQLFIDYTIVFIHQAQRPIERRLRVYAGQANSDPSLDGSLLGLWPLKENNGSTSPVPSLKPLSLSQPKAKGFHASSIEISEGTGMRKSCPRGLRGSPPKVDSLLWGQETTVPLWVTPGKPLNLSQPVSSSMRRSRMNTVCFATLKFYNQCQVIFGFYRYWD